MSHGKALVICCAVQAADGLLVTLKWTMRRRWCASTTRPYRTRNVAVGTVKKSIEHSSVTWFLRKARHACDGGLRRRRGMYFETVASDTTSPSLSSSPCTLGAPQVTLLAAMVLMRDRISAASGGRPPRRRLRHRQYARNLRRCHRMTVAGWTTVSTRSQPDHQRRSSTQRARSAFVNRGALDRSSQHSDLLSQGQILKGEFVARAEAGQNGTEERTGDVEHGRRSLVEPP